MRRSAVESEGGTKIAPARTNTKQGAQAPDITPGRLGDSKANSVSAFASGGRGGDMTSGGRGI